MKVLLFSLFCLLPAGSAFAAVTTITRTWSGSITIPDSNDVGASNTIVISSTGPTLIDSVTIQLELEGGWNGDLFAYLVHDTRLAILLNRPGRTLADPDGFASSGMNVIFSDSAPSDIHLALPDSGTPIGAFQPDGRMKDPSTVIDTDPRTAFLSVFNGSDINGAWTLFLADQASGEVSTLKSWTMNVTVVPEPSIPVLAGLALITIAFSRKRPGSGGHDK